MEKCHFNHTRECRTQRTWTLAMVNWTTQEYQITGGYLSLASALILTVMFFMTNLCLMNCFKFIRLREVKTTNSPVAKYLPRWLNKLTEPIFVRRSFCVQYFCLIACCISNYSQAFRKLHRFQGKYAHQFCIISAFGYEFGYGVGKALTLVFLGIKASLTFRIGTSSSERWVKAIRNYTIFLSIAMIALSQLIIALSTFEVDNLGDCMFFAPEWLNATLTFVDSSSNFIMLIVFLVPLSGHLNMTDMSLTKHTKDSMRSTLVHNAILGIITAISAVISLGLVTLFEEIEGLTSSFISIDLMINCICQAISCRKVWEVTDESGSYDAKEALIGGEDRFSKEKLTGVELEPLRELSDGNRKFFKLPLSQVNDSKAILGNVEPNEDDKKVSDDSIPRRA
jgi:hypothetical protein